MSKRRGGRFEVEWVTISYRTLRRWLLVLAAVAIPVTGWFAWHTINSRRAADELARRLRELDRRVEAARENGRRETELKPIDGVIASARSRLRADDLATAGQAADEAEARLDDLLSAVRDRARLLRVEGDVQVRAVDSLDWQPAVVGMELAPGDLVRTGPNSAAQYRNALDDSLGTLGANTLMRIARSERDRDSGKTESIVELDQGQLTLDTDELGPGSKSEVKTRNVRASVLSNTVVDVGFEADTGESRVGVVEGTARVRADGETLELGAAERVAVSARGIEHARLLAAPALLSPERYQVLLVSELGPRGFELEWESIQGARSYEVALATSPLFGRPLRRWGALATNYARVRDLPVGDYFWRVIAVDGQDRRGVPSAVGSFRVSDAVPEGDPPRLEVEKIEPLGEGVFLCEGVTQPGVYLVIDNGYALTPVKPKDDGAFRQVIVVAEQGMNVITFTARNSQGLETRKKHRVEVVLP